MNGAQKTKVLGTHESAKLLEKVRSVQGPYFTDEEPKEQRR